MEPKRIRLINIASRRVDWHPVADITWDKVWTISHIWDWGHTYIRIPLHGVDWKSNSFSSARRFELIFRKTCEIVRQHGGEYVWVDTACIDQGQEEAQVRERNEQISFMGAIYSRSAGSVAFGRQTRQDGFAEIIYAYEDGRKAWVCDWFERVWTFQELQLPKKLFFVSGDHTLTQNQVYLFVLMTSPYLTSPHPSPPRQPNDAHVSTQDVVNALSPLSKSNPQRSLMQTSKRGCRLDYINDKVYGILGLLPDQLKNMEINRRLSLEQTVLDLMQRMSSNDVLDTLTFNTLPPPNASIHDVYRWSGMVRLDGSPTDHPSYETDVYPSGSNARVRVSGNPPRATTIVSNAHLLDVVVERSGPAGPEPEPVRAWPSLASLAPFANLTGDFSGVKRSADYEHAVGRAGRSLAANWKVLKPLVERAVRGGIGGRELSSILMNPPTNIQGHGVPPNRLGDPTLFGERVTVLLCRSKQNESFHYGIVVKRNDDSSWHKVCTAAFSSTCVVADSRRVEEFVIGK